jgi:hypothetical protein
VEQLWEASVVWSEKAADDLRSALDGWAEQWRRFGAPVADALEPGISAEEIDALAAPHGLQIPLEIKVLWGWHNGAGIDPATSHRHSVGPAGFEFHSAQDALDKYVFNREVHREGVEELYWGRSWLPFLTAGANRLYVDCDRLDTFGASPVRLVSWEWENHLVDRAVSVANLVRMWTWLLEQDLYRLDRSGSGEAVWQPVDWQAIPGFIRVTGLA